MDAVFVRGREGGRERGREGGREGEREGGREGTKASLLDALFLLFFRPH